MRISLIIVSLALTVTGLHQLAQRYAFGLVDDAGGTVLVTSFVNVVEVWNKGISFGMFHSVAYGQWLLSALALGICAALLLWLQRAGNGYRTWAAGLIIGGALGNTVDRLRYGAVADYLDFHIGSYHWPAFNVTDVAICFGVALLLFEKPFEKVAIKLRNAGNVRNA